MDQRSERTSLNRFFSWKLVEGKTGSSVTGDYSIGINSLLDRIFPPESSSRKELKKQLEFNALKSVWMDADNAGLDLHLSQPVEIKGDTLYVAASSQAIAQNISLNSRRIIEFLKNRGFAGIKRFYFVKNGDKLLEKSSAGTRKRGMEEPEKSIESKGRNHFLEELSRLKDR